MSPKKFDSRALRQLANEIVANPPGDQEILPSDREDYATSLVRQWVTCDGRATLFLGEREFYFTVWRTPLGKHRATTMSHGRAWMKALIKDWKIGPDDLLEALGQLNRGQSAEVVSGDGVPLELWVNPKENSRGVRPLVKLDLQPHKRDHLKIATDVMEKHLRNGVDAEELEALARSVAAQWQQHEGHGSLFLDEHHQLYFEFTENGDGTCAVNVKGMPVDLEAAASSFGFPANALWELIPKINLGQQIEYRDQEGILRRLWHDPKTRRFVVQPVDPMPTPAVGPVGAAPIYCPKCSATLDAWLEGRQEQTCSRCGHRILLFEGGTDKSDDQPL